ncbi:hypothetical protein DFH06DRAFT_505892 [Mycena polygramma]|nr:hypothetical protein DFH06DRAFT_505892 [Mycena polygramma]
MDSQHTSNLLIPASLSSASLRTRLTKIDAEIAEVPAKFGPLTNERNDVLAALKSIVYPILTLPPEITIEIFLQYVADERLRLPTSYVPPLRGPPLLASICRAWRRIALSLGKIWADVIVGQTTEMLFQCCLARAGQQPLLLDMDIRQPYSRPLFAAAVQYSEQWQEFACTIDLSSLSFSMTMDAIRGRIPLLRKLELAGTTHNGPPAHITAFSDAPQLRELDIVGFPRPSPTLVPWAQLISLRCWMYDTAEVVEMLGRTPRLEELEVIRLLDGYPLSPDPVQLNHLHTLKIRTPHCEDYLPGVTLPALRVLDVYHNPNLSHDPALPSFLLRSSWQLRSLSVIDLGLSIVTRALAATPTVEEVHIGCRINREWSQDWAQDDELFPFLHRLSTDAEFLPNMRTLRMSFDFGRFPHQLVEMLDARWYPRCDAWTQLKCCKIWIPGAPYHQAVAAPDVRDRLRALEADGLDLEVPNIRL